MNAPHEALQSVFHEPSRMAIVSELSAHTGGLSFAELKERCRLTDGNLSRHLAALDKARAVRIKKSFVGAKPRTTISLSEKGRREFLEYLSALEAVLKQAAAGIKAGDEEER